MTRCACPPGGPYSAEPCCREDSDHRCPPTRCLHPGPSSRDLLGQLEETHEMLRAMKERRDRLRAGLAEAQNTVEALVVEVERLEHELLESVREIGRTVGPDERGNGCEGVYAAVVANRETPDLG
jgi:hypothetical protein